MKLLNSCLLVLILLFSTMAPLGKAEAERNGIPIVMYHSIGYDPTNELVVSPERFALEMEYLKNAGYTALSFADLLKWKQGQQLPPKPIIITLDDGYEDNYSVAFPILQKLQMKATIFLATGFIDQLGRLTWKQIKEMADSNLVEYGAHTIHHVDLKKSSRKVQQEEIFESKRMIEEKVGKPVIAFAYPSGRYTDQTVQILEKAGLDFAVTTKPGWAKATQGYLELHRIRINGSLSLPGFKHLLP